MCGGKTVQYFKVDNDAFIYIGTSSFEIDHWKVTYEGHFYEDGKAYGHGIAKVVNDSSISYEGTFKGNRLNGLGR